MRNAYTILIGIHSGRYNFGDIFLGRRKIFNWNINK
jgi:hypothetical protein